MNVSLPDQMKTCVESQAASGRYGDASDYIRDLIRRDQERNGNFARLQQMVDEEIAGGITPRRMQEILTQSRKRATAPVDGV